MPQPTPLANALSQYAPPQQTPSTPLAQALMEYAKRVQGDFQHGLDESAQGFGEMMNGQLATGIPRTFLGGLGWMGSPVSGAVSPLLNPIMHPVAQGVHDYVGKPVENATGYPADLTTELALALALPKALHGAGKAMNSAVPYLASLGDAVGVKPTAPGQYNMFIGGRAKNFPHDMVPRAEKLEAEGISASDIHDMTGLHRGADGKWRAEIADNNAWFDPNTFEEYGGAVGQKQPLAVPTNHLLDHNGLYNEYPDLGEMRTVFANPNSIPHNAPAAYAPRKDFVAIANDVSPQNGLGLMLHEVQHAIQKREGFANGGLPSNGDYRSLAGEVEARNTVARMHMTPEERRATPPWLTEDVPRENQIVGSRGELVSAPKSPISSPVGGGSALDAYHGSPTLKNIADFDTNAPKRTDYGYLGEGMYVSPKEWIARSYAGPKGYVHKVPVPDGKFKDFPYVDSSYQSNIEAFAKSIGVNATPKTAEWAREFANKMREQGYVGARGMNGDGSVAEMVIFKKGKD